MTRDRIEEGLNRGSWRWKVNEGRFSIEIAFKPIGPMSVAILVEHLERNRPANVNFDVRFLKWWECLFTPKQWKVRRLK